MPFRFSFSDLIKLRGEKSFQVLVKIWISTSKSLKDPKLLSFISRSQRCEAEEVSKNTNLRDLVCVSIEKCLHVVSFMQEK